MPPAPSLTSTDQEEETAFQVLNKDNLPLGITGQPILKPFNSETQKLKPNLIVHPIRRIPNNLDENKHKTFARSNGNINNINDEISRNAISRSHGNLCHNNSTSQMKLEDLKEQLDLEAFTKTLDSKLKRLQKEENKQQKKCNSEPPSSRKPFVTTVKKGQFLDPPPEIANLVGIRVEEQKYVKRNPKEINKLYAFASHPRVLSRTPPKTVHQTRCEAAAWAAAKYVGTAVPIRQDDSTKARDISTLQSQEKKLLKDKKLSGLNEQIDPQLARVRVEQAQRRAEARKRAINQQIVRPKRHAITTFATAEVIRDRILDIAQLQQLLITRNSSDAATQTEETIVKENYKECKEDKQDAQIQVHPTDLFDFITEVQPIVEILVSKTIEEALIEVLEEEEMLAMKEQQRKFLEYMSQQTSSEVDDETGFSKETVEKLSRGMNKFNYIPNLITSV